MPYFNIVSQSAESTVVTEYKPQSKRSERTRAKQTWKRSLSVCFAELGYERLTIHKEADLIGQSADAAGKAE